MSFRANKNQQLSLFDSSFGLTERERKFLEKSWAKVFADEIFPAIDEERFSVLYSSTASRPNTPVNIVVGALIIKELFDLSDDEVVENLMLDIHYQYALHTTSFYEQPLSDKTLSRFRKRCYQYEKETGIDLLHDCVCDLSGKIAKLMNINSHIHRMDSLMIEANIRKMSRIELLYSCVARLVRYIRKNNPDFDLIGLEHYCHPDDRNYVIYHCRSIDVDERIKVILMDADSLILRCGEEIKNTEEYLTFLRCIKEQTYTENGIRHLHKKNSGAIHTNSLQSPTDTDATFNHKSGKEHIGYVANIVEAVSNNGTIITDYQYEPNTYSDIKFLEDHIKHQKPRIEKEYIVADGAYTSQNCKDEAASKNIEIINTSLKGITVPDIYANFIINDNRDEILSCPLGNKPLYCKCKPTTHQIRAYFSIETCANCPNREKCRAKISKKSSVIVISYTAIEKANLSRQLGSEEFQHWRRIRNGVESIPSLLRNRYHVDKTPVRGKTRTKFFFGFKVMALNFNKLLRYERGLFRCTSNPLLG